jgi:hydroxylaminobenzene mutase
LSALQGVFVLAVGLLWPKLKLGMAASWVAFWLFIYGAASILAAYTIAAIWGVSNETWRPWWAQSHPCACRNGWDG